uniref:SET domain-containing protein n=1 Tax=Magallana gigas TaxID=29159 RepID=A0A8W8N442_MAGGI|nr:PR domain zinc finger protein 12 [Crassostrea gigas]
MAKLNEKRILSFLIIGALVSSIHTAECGGHHSLKWTNHCYSFHAEKRSRDDASYVCHQEGGYLAVINSKEEESFIAGYLHRNKDTIFDNTDFSHLKHEEEYLMREKTKIEREYCKHYFEGTLEQSTLNVLRKNEISPSLPNRAQLTTPPGFSIRRSLIPRANMGVWTDAFVPKHTILAEYEGEFVESPTDFTYCWQIDSGPHKLFIDGKNENISNWLRYVNCARNAFEENTDTFNCGSKKFYYTIKDVHPNNELLVWYGTSYGKWLDIEKINPENDFPNGSLNARIGSIYYTRDKSWINNDHTHVTYTNWSRDLKARTGNRSVGLILTYRNGEWQWIPERDYSYYVTNNSVELPFVCESSEGT